MEKFLYRYSKLKAKLKIVVVYPNSYFIGMSNAGFQFVYHLLESNPYILCERAFIEKGSVRVKTFESGRELGLFDALFFSISYENDILNMIRILILSGIPIYSEGRIGPVIITG